MVCDFIEEKLRVAAGQYKQSQRWPNANRLSKLVSYTKSMVEALEKEREKWAKDHAAEIKAGGLSEEVEGQEQCLFEAEGFA